jgi:3-phosphoshikimate 1-carboxyvinyltransferase
MIEIKPLQRMNAVVTVPGSKSYTQRALVIAALARGPSRLRNGLVSEDTGYLTDALCALGADIRLEDVAFLVAGTGGRIGNPGPGRDIFLGNNGTALRFLTTLTSLGQGEYRLTGDPRLCERPVLPLLEALQILGVAVHTRDGQGYPPLTVKASGLRGGSVTLTDVESSQYVSSLLISAPYARGAMDIRLDGRTASQPYIDMTIGTMNAFGVTVENREERCYHVPAGQCYQGRDYDIEGDVSSASYFFLAAALCRGAVTVQNLNPLSRQGDLRLLEILEELGCAVERGETWIRVAGCRLREGDCRFDMGDMPDMAPTLAVLSAFRPGRTVIANVAHLRVKESNRIASLVTELNRTGIQARETADGLIIDGGKPHGAEIETYNDHRIAMSFAVAGLAAPGMKIGNEQCVKKSFPGFWVVLESLS